MEDQIIDNLLKTEEELLEANNSLINIKEEYLNILNNTESSSFFNLDNIYFWFVLIGLLFLVFSLWFFLSALKQREFDSLIKKEKLTKINREEKKALKTKKRKAVKIKVVKIK